MPNLPGGFNNPLTANINSFRSNAGQALPPNLQHQMEAAFGADLSSVRVHESHAASHTGAKAFADGNDIFFAPGNFQPYTDDGQRLLSHELAHVVQQSNGGVNVDAIQQAAASVSEEQ